MGELKSYSINENTYNENTGIAVNTTRTISAPTYEQIFNTIDSENHELLINQVNSNNNEYNDTKSNIVRCVVTVGMLAFANYMNYTHMGNIDVELIRKVMEVLVPVFTGVSLTAIVYQAVSSIIALIKKKEVVKEGNEFVESNYPEELEKVNGHTK